MAISNAIRDLQFQGGDSAAILSRGNAQANQVAQNTPVQNFNNRLMEMLTQFQQRSTPQLQQFREQEYGARSAQTSASNAALLNPALRGYAPSTIMNAGQSAAAPYAAAEQGASQVTGAFQDRLSGFGDAITRAQGLVQQFEQQRQQQEQKQRDDMRYAISIASEAGAAGLESLLKANPNAFKNAGLDAESYIAAIKSQEAAKQKQQDFENNFKLQQERRLAGGGTGAGSGTTIKPFTPSLTFEQFISQKEQESQASLAPQAREALRPEYNALVASEERRGEESKLLALSPRTRELLKNPKGYFDLTPTEKGKILGELANAGVDTAQLQEGKKRPLSATQADDLVQAQIAKAGVLALKKKLDELSKTGPVIGRLRQINPYDPQVVAIMAEINRIVPGLARGVFKEVGVLTDTDINRYTATLANPRATKEQITQLHNDTIAKIEQSLKLITSTYSDLGYDLGKLDVSSGSTGTTGTTSSGINYTIE